jgi:hypothetical protein
VPIACAAQDGVFETLNIPPDENLLFSLGLPSSNFGMSSVRTFRSHRRINTVSAVSI